MSGGPKPPDARSDPAAFDIWAGGDGKVPGQAEMYEKSGRPDLAIQCWDPLRRCGHPNYETTARKAMEKIGLKWANSDPRTFQWWAAHRAAQFIDQGRPDLARECWAPLATCSNTLHRAEGMYQMACLVPASEADRCWQELTVVAGMGRAGGHAAGRAAEALGNALLQEGRGSDALVWFEALVMMQTDATLRRLEETRVEVVRREMARPPGTQPSLAERVSSSYLAMREERGLV